MINNIKKIVLASAIISTSLVAGDSDFSFDSETSLVAIEAGYSVLNNKMSDGVTSLNNDYNFGHIGLKLGARSDDYRIFVSAAYYADTDDTFDSLATFGVEGQYMFEASKALDLFIGLNLGLASIEFTGDGENFSRTATDVYYGIDVGTNIHVSKDIDIDIGARYMSLNTENTKSSVSYQFDNVISGYMSVIYKY
ncbi:outer membrane beta-barrel protein [Candidatus Sulfurimonas baltica]|uniref:Outer membrane beta-barrel protein n=1 Tax=Candidatus Sulfurimonas baltica TaxID=2740404 RepID=A0A7S7LV19_9BACT|nr:outer membrane beta-barrel protein [Candidatus Sulfurimonas baltica]QOY51923.1 outer membrane beta-barrel protein [Candidatus Sulfurimonas baltica]